jgi:hypothetical protein
MYSRLSKLPRAITAVGLLILILTSMTGCLYPNDQTPGSQASAREAVLTAQDAVNRYKDQTGLLPIQNADSSVPLYEKFKVDFGKLQRMGFIAQVPTAAFENGGANQFLIIDEETKPQVKLLDLTVFQAVGDVQKKVNGYRQAHSNSNPAGVDIYPGFPEVDFGKMNMSAPDIRSMYPHQPLNILVNDKGQVFVDYGIDIATAIKKAETKPKPNEDLRRVLIEASYYVPVRSPVYRWVNGAPQAVKSE